MHTEKFTFIYKLKGESSKKVVIEDFNPEDLHDILNSFKALLLAATYHPETIAKIKIED